MSSEWASSIAAKPLVTAIDQQVMEDGDTHFSIGKISCYPNPFNATTTFRFDLVSPGMVDFSIYNILGQRIFVQDEIYEAGGQKELRWDATGFPSGVYFYRMVTNGAHLTGKVTVQK